MPGPIRRRDFCVNACQAASIVTLGGLSAACDEASSVTQPSRPTGGGPAPSPSPSPQPGTPGPSTPPPTSNLIVPLPIVAASVAQRTLSVSIGASSPLAEVWDAAKTERLLDAHPWDFLLTRTDASSFSVVTASCTHEGCLIGQTAKPIFVCQCHGSRYDHNGTVLNGPATVALRQYAAEFVNGVLTVRF